jgi:hypothetical protein
MEERGGQEAGIAMAAIAQPARRGHGVDDVPRVLRLEQVPKRAIAEVRSRKSIVVK